MNSIFVLRSDKFNKTFVFFWCWTRSARDMSELHDFHW